MFAPQKGATAAEVAQLEAALTHWATVVEAHPASPMSRNRPIGPGTAADVPVVDCMRDGCRGLGLRAASGSRSSPCSGPSGRSGVDVVLDLVGLDAALTGADLVVTGEGSLDAQTLAGKAVRGVAQRAAAHGIPVVAVCGRLALDDADLSALGVRAAYPLSDLEPDPRRSIEDAAATCCGAPARRSRREWLSRPPG